MPCQNGISTIALTSGSTLNVPSAFTLRIVPHIHSGPVAPGPNTQRAPVNGEGEDGLGASGMVRLIKKRRKRRMETRPPSGGNGSRRLPLLDHRSHHVAV